MLDKQTRPDRESETGSLTQNGPVVLACMPSRTGKARYKTTIKRMFERTFVLTNSYYRRGHDRQAKFCARSCQFFSKQKFFLRCERRSGRCQSRSRMDASPMNHQSYKQML